ncbi:cytochrome oxidase assembly protein-domain-containing protein [Myxozyma melibiosi]|uniref:Cytochrome oxidase assembly protein-domain-containing protein n=1 Tax=Myxozyma melibiosi TaxID=54550 RepID=A0ABR1F2H7_9ASCO
MVKELARPALFFAHNARLQQALLFGKTCSRSDISATAGRPFTALSATRAREFNETLALAAKSAGGSSGLGSFGLLAAGGAGAGKMMYNKSRQFSSLATRSSSSSGSFARRMFSTSRQLLNSIASPATAAPVTDTTAAPRVKKVLTDRSVGVWLIGTSFLVFGIVVIGGLTRLTESGLSITEWKPVTGSIPPLTQQDWEAEFEKYRASPEFKLLNSNMTLDEFKFIFFMEWSHRLWGRMIGLVFVLPGAYFIARGRVSARVTKRIAAIAGLIGFQGFIGWWMVKSGLSDHFLADDGIDGKYKDSHPRVSQYRLATHLGLAFVVYLSMLWTGLEVLKENKWMKSPQEAVALASKLSNPALRKYKLLAAGLLALVFTTAMSGAFVAGLDAGLIYNDFPFMGEGLIPPTSEIFSTYYSRSRDDSDLIWRNMLENPATVQLEHRILATTSFCSIVAFHIYSTLLNKRGLLPRSVFKASHGVIGFVTLQVALGISTLWYLVPIPLAAAHQATSLALLTEVLILCIRLRKPRAEVLQLLQKRNAAAAAATPVKPQVLMP